MGPIDPRKVGVLMGTLWRVIAIALVISLALVFGAFALCESAKAAPPKPCAKAFGVKAGETVPCDGVLAPASDIVQALECLDVSLPLCHAHLASEKGRREADEERSQSLLRSERTRGNKCCQLALDPPPPPFIKSPLFYGLTTGFITALVVALTVVLLYETEAVTP
jgi:hypothetical protein